MWSRNVMSHLKRSHVNPGTCTPVQDYDVRSTRRTSFMTHADGTTCGLPEDWPTGTSKQLKDRGGFG